MCGAGRLVTGTKSLISGNCFPPFYACWSSAEICTQQPARTPAQLAFHPPVSDGPGHAGTRPAPAWCKGIPSWAPRTRVTARLIASYTPRIFWQYRTFSGKSDQSPPTPAAERWVHCTDSARKVVGQSLRSGGNMNTLRRWYVLYCPESNTLTCFVVGMETKCLSVLWWPEDKTLNLFCSRLKTVCLKNSVRATTNWSDI